MLTLEPYVSLACKWPIDFDNVFLFVLLNAVVFTTVSGLFRWLAWAGSCSGHFAGDTVRSLLSGHTICIDIPTTILFEQT